jgi:GntR family transcriptional regulator, transcriptional repressor for pyruvate dehydrogenase complex
MMPAMKMTTEDHGIIGASNRGTGRRRSRPSRRCRVMQPINRSTLSQRVARAIKDFIIDRGLAPGDKLPSEHELCRYFQVSRVIVREALQALAAAGLVRIRHGKGTFVEHFDGGTVAEQLTFGLSDDLALLRHMLELRTIVECGAIELAATRATAEDHNHLRAILEQMRHAAAQGRPLEEADRAFHQAVVAAAKNPALSRLGAVIAEFFRLKSLSLPPSISWHTPAAEVREHAGLLDAIERGDGEGARRLLKEALAIYGVAVGGGEEALSDEVDAGGDRVPRRAR